MLYTLAAGVADTPHYGLALAAVVPLPADVLGVATRVARVLRASEESRARRASVVGVLRRRRLVLGLREMLVQARDGRLEGEALRGWLRGLMRGFVVRMEEIEGDEDVDVERDGDKEGVESVEGMGDRGRHAESRGDEDMLQTPC